jgi:hypothetical protein
MEVLIFTIAFIILFLKIIKLYGSKSVLNKSNEIIASNGREITSPSYDTLISTSKETQSIPDDCPHCKSPNTKKIRLCEWCGNQIC